MTALLGMERRFALAMLLVAIHGSRLTAQSLASAHVRADFDSRGLRSLTDLDDRRVHRVDADGFAITIGDQSFTSSALATPTREVARDHITYRYAAGPF